MNNLLQNILIKPNVLNESGIQAIERLIAQSKRTDLEIFDPAATNATGQTQWKLDKSVRDTQHVDLSPVLEQVNTLLSNIVHKIINPYYGIQIRDAELPQLLCYGVGGHYHPHVDAEGLWTNEDGSQEWRKNVDRDLSVLLYINDDYEGGELVFPDLHIRVRPKRGMLIAFPSTHHYVHGVEPVTKGERFVIVTWMTINGIPTIAEMNHSAKQKTEESIRL